MVRRALAAWLVISAVTILLISGCNQEDTGGGDRSESSITQQSGSDEGANSDALIEVTGTATKVDVNLVERPSPGDRRFQVSIDINQGWHLQANPPSSQGMIPTSVELIDTRDGDRGSPVSMKAAYPEGEELAVDIGSGVQKTSVYSDSIVIGVRTDEPLQEEQLRHLLLDVRVQGCSSDGRCLPPSTIEVRVGEIS